MSSALGAIFTSVLLSAILSASANADEITIAMTAVSFAENTIVGVRFETVGRLYHFDHSNFPSLAVGEYVIVETAQGTQLGQVMAFRSAENPNQVHKPIRRLATARDLMLRQHWQSRQEEALERCRAAAEKLTDFPPTKFIAAQYNYDGSSLTFLYSAEEKRNTARLSQRLRREFPARLHFRLIGPRDVAKYLGGYGACGELRCCSTFLTNFSPISVRMAKAQGLTLNQSEITGMCGRLRCCLLYEYEQYVKARKQLPRRNKRIGTPLGPGKVIDVLPLKDAVVVLIPEKGRHTFTREELVPLEELRALQEKARQPCSVHGDEPCSCGLPPGARNQDHSSS